MPPLGMHLTLARELRSDLQHPALAADPGAYYLGSTSPDIRVLTKGDRSHTHFFDLACFDEQRGTEALLREHPELADPSRLDDGTIAFLCGYISHLEMDETWINEVYRPCFGERSPLKGDLLANLLDRVLQHELDLRDMRDRSAAEQMRHDLMDTTVEVTVGFLEREALLRWRDITAERLSDPPDWQRFSRFASRHLRAYGVESEADLAHFLSNIPDLLERSIREVTPERIAAFQERSRARAREAIREYLA